MNHLSGRVMWPVTTSLAMLFVISLTTRAGAADVSAGSVIYGQRCTPCHGPTTDGRGRAASLRQLQTFAAEPSLHPGGAAPFQSVSLPDLAAYISSQVVSSFFIQGTVAEISGVVLPGLRVAARSDYLTLSDLPEAITDTNGVYRFDSLPAGDFKLTLVAPAYWIFPDTREVSVYPGSAPGDGQDFTTVSTNNPNGTNLVFISSVQHVTMTGDDRNSGRSWLGAKRTIGAAISAASAGGEIWVAEGVYHELIGLYGKQLFGGFAGTEVIRAQRDWRRHASVLDGTAAALEPFGIPPGIMVRMGDADTNHACLDGLTVMNGAATSADVAGGGVFVEANSAPLICHCCFLTNIAGIGGALYCSRDSHPAIIDNIFEQNYAYTGGALYLDSGCSPQVIANNLVVSNRSDDGAAGLFCSGNQVSVINNTFIGNEVGFGGAGAVEFDAGSAVVVNNLMAFNTGGVTVGGTASVAESHNCMFANSDADFSGIDASPTDVLKDPACRDVAGKDFHLRPSSPCLDAGDDSVIATPLDLDGLPRWARLRVDIGAYELPPPALTFDSGSSPDPLRLTWPAEEDAFVLESCTNLALPDWRAVPYLPATNGMLRSVAVSVASPGCFYRLRQAPK